MLDQQVVLEVEGVEEGQAVDTCLQALDFLFDFLDIGEIVRLFDPQAIEFLLCFAQQARLLPVRAIRRAWAERRVRTILMRDGLPSLAILSANSLEGVGASQVTFDQVG